MSAVEAPYTHWHLGTGHYDSLVNYYPLDLSHFLLLVVVMMLVAAVAAVTALSLFDNIHLGDVRL